MVMTALSLILATAQSHHARMEGCAEGRFTFEMVLVYWL
jgi:hypothetical protein